MDDPTQILSRIPSMNYEEQMRAYSPESFDNIVQNRRSVRVYTEEKIPEAVMQKVLDWALLAPTSSNLQCWEFYWVKDQAKRTQLIHALFNQPAAQTSQELIVAVAKLNSWKTIRKQMLDVFEKESKVPKAAKDYYSKLVPVLYTQGFLGLFGFMKKIALTLTGLFKPVPREPTSRADMRVWAVKTTALACQNIMMGFSAHGYDSCPMEGYDSCRVKKILGLGRNDEVVMVISAGKRAKNGVYGPRIRMPREQFIKVI